MKNITSRSRFTLLLGALAFCSSSALTLSFAGAGHDHDAHKGHDHGAHEGHDHGSENKGEEAKAGPNGGRVISTVHPHIEFFVLEDRKVQITAVNDEHEAVELGELTVKLIGGSRKNPLKLKFVKQGDVLVSETAFPEGNNFPVVLQIKETPDSKTVIAKFTLNLSDCPGCDYKEYACVCGHN